MTKQQQLLSLIKSLSLPLAEKDAKVLIKDLKGEELDRLIEKYTAVKDLQDKVKEAALEADPKAVEELEQKLNNRLAKLDQEEIDEEEKTQEKYDQEMDKLDAEAASRIDIILDKQKLDNLRLLQDANSLIQDMTSAVKEESNK